MEALVIVVMLLAVIALLGIVSAISWHVCIVIAMTILMAIWLLIGGRGAVIPVIFTVIVGVVGYRFLVPQTSLLHVDLGVPAPVPGVSIGIPTGGPRSTYEWLNSWVIHNPLGWFLVGVLAKAIHSFGRG